MTVNAYRAGKLITRCDRVLWKSDRLRLRKYDALMNIKLSDHKPVFCLLDVVFENIDYVKKIEEKKRVIEDILLGVI